MGYLDNAKERLRDIGQGVRDVIKGRPSDPYSRKKAIAEREFRDIRDNPAPKDTSGFTPVKDSSGIVIYRGGGGRGGGGRGKERRGVGSSLAEIKAENQRIAKQKAQEEATKKAAIELAKTRTQEALRSKQLISSLRSSQQITREAKERGQGFSRTEMQRRLKELGTSTTELRQASRASKEQFRKTGISVTEQIRLEEKAKRKEVISVKDVKPSVTSFRGDNVYFSIPDNTKKPGEIYSKKLGGYVQANANGQFLDTTAIIKTPTTKEQIKLDRTTKEKLKDIKEKVIETQITPLFETGKVLGAKANQKIKPVAIEFYKSQAKTSGKIEQKIKPVTSFISTQAQDFGKTNLFLSGKVKEKATPYIQAGIISQAKVSERIQEGARDLTKDFGKTTLVLGQEIKQKATPYIQAGIVSQAKTSEKIQETISPVFTGIKKQAKDFGKTNLFLYDTAKEKAKQKIKPVAIEFYKSQAKTSGKIEDVTGIKDIKEIRKLNIEAKKAERGTFQFISRRGIEEVPTAKTWFGASLNVAGKSAEVLSLESGLAKKRAEFIQGINQPYISDMTDYPGFGRRKITQKEIQESAEFIGGYTKGAIQLGVVDVPLIFGGGAILSKAIRPIRTFKYQKYKKYLNKDNPKIVDVTRKIESVKEDVPLIRSETKLRQAGERTFLKFKGKQKGELSLERPRPTESFKGKVIEKLKTGENGKGTVKKIKGKYTESVVFEESGIKKVTTIQEDGKGIIKLYKDGKLVGEFPLEKGAIPKVKYKETKIKSEAEERFGIPGTRKTIRAQEDGNILNIRSGQKRVSPTGIIRTEETGILRVGKTKGMTQEVIQKESVYDFSKVGLERKVKSLKRNGKSVTEKEEIGKKIVFGKKPEPQKVDLSGFTKQKGEQRLFKKTTPRQDRTIVQKLDQRIITRFGESKDIKKASPGTTFIQTIKKAKDKTKTSTDQIRKQIQEQKQKAEVLFIEPTKQFLKDVNLKIPSIPKVGAVIKPTTKERGLIPLVSGASAQSRFTAKIETTTPQITSISRPSLIDTQRDTQQIKTQQAEITLTEFKQPQRTRQVSEQIFKTAQKPKVEQKIKQEVKQKTLQRTAQLFGLKQKLELKQKLVQEFGRPIKPTKIKPTKLFIPETTPAKKEPTAKQKIKQMFEVFAREKGEDVLIGEAKTEFLAGKLLKQKLRSDLSASGFIARDGEKLKARKFTSFDFGVSKIDPFRYVQKRGYRLSSGSEIFKIQRAKKSKSKKTNWLFS
ncbi:hypothetical protein BMS3Abin17_00029 [archaeon BMS3Abin17]|nr:hypothetical protein BMS3Abin17_00029 [archaeon BMS3Abin17]